MSKEKIKDYIYTRVSTVMQSGVCPYDGRYQVGKGRSILCPCAQLTRFGRNVADVLSTLQMMQDYGVNLLCVEEEIDSLEPEDRQPSDLSENKKIAKQGGQIAGNARKEIESNTSKPVITSKNATELNSVVTKLIEDSKDK